MTQTAGWAFFAGMGFMSHWKKGNRGAVRAENVYLVTIQQDISSSDRCWRELRLRKRRPFDGVRVKSAGPDAY